MRAPRALPAALVAAAVCLAAWPVARAEVIEEVAAFVNGQILTRSELLEREASVESQLSRQFTGQDLHEKVEQAKQNLLTDMIREVLLLQRAENLGLDLERVYKQALDNLKSQQGIKTNDEMKNLLRQEGISEDELRKILLRFNVPDIMINLEVRQKLVVTDEEIKKYYDEHSAEFKVEETYKIREIVLLAEGHTPEEIQAKTAAVMADLQAGVSFPEMVLKHSEAPSRFQEGLVGPLRAPDISEELLGSLRTLAVGEVAGPIRSEHGVHFVQLDTRTEARQPELDEVRRGIENKLKQAMFGDELEKYWKTIYEQNRIKIVDKYRAYAADIPAGTTT